MTSPGHALDSAIVQARELFESQLPERMADLARALRDLAAQSSMHGVRFGSPHLVQAKELCYAEIDRRAILVWQCLHRAALANALIFHRDLLQRLTEDFDSFKPSLMADIEQEWLREEQVVKRMISNSSWLSEALGNRWEQARRKQLAEMTLFVSSLAAQDQTPGQPSITNNYYAPVGSVQVGAQSLAIVDQTIDPTSLQAVARALDSVTGGLARISDAVVPAQPIAELVDEARAELRRDRPNPFRIRAILSGIGEAIQTTASLVPRISY